IIFVNDEVGLPVRQEFYTKNDAGERVLQYSVELRNVRLEADDALFSVPRQFRKVSVQEFIKSTNPK
ncbi:MAG TPA: hypothetical protein VK468_05570, partial [Pyrinomonadaceae bacterium]|nr:hypothetical protein [Pyrinomonadaceae bacterium]